MAAQSRQQSKPSVFPENGRQVILDAALRLLRDEGPTALRVRRVAAEAGCSTMGVYTHFGRKDGLTEALWLDGFRRFGAALAAVPTKGNPLTRVRRLLLAYRNWALAQPTYYQLMFGWAVPEFDPSPESRAEAVATFSVLADAVAAAQAAGALGPGDPGSTAMHLWALAHGMVMIELAGVNPQSGRGDPARSYQEAIDTMLRGLRPA
jgi:AcrR family transcriptional regulator